MVTPRSAPACLIALALALIPASSSAQWVPGGIVVPGGGSPKQLCTDGQGGVFFGWRDGRNQAVTLSDVFATRMTPSGTVAPGFPPTGLPVCTAVDYQDFCEIVSDSHDGAILYWLDARNSQVDHAFRLYSSRITSDGQIAPGWPVDGLDVSGPLTGDENCPEPVADSQGGAYFFWDNYTTGNSDVYGQHLTATGTPAPGWPPEGLPIATGTGVENQEVEFTVPDGTGGALVAWLDQRADAPGQYVQRILPSGATFPGWPADGLRIASEPGPHALVPDGTGGGFAGSGATSPVSGFFSALHIVRFTGAGQIAPGWSFGGNLVCDAADVRTVPKLAADGLGGVLAQWDDYRNSSYASTFAVRLAADGKFVPGWPKNGRRVSTLATQQNTFKNSILADGAGGMYSAFESQTSLANLSAIQHLGADGSPAAGWGSDGAILNPADGQYYPTLAQDGSGGAYVAWDNYAANGLYLQYYPAGGVVSTQLSLVSADALSDRVTLTWSSPAAATLTATVERRGESTNWQSLGTPTVEGTDRLKFEDRTVTSGARYGYRLSYLDGTSRQYSSETRVDVPIGAVFALEGARPNPAVDHLSAAFSLADDSPASLTLLDVMGREVSRRELGSLGAGRHVVPLDLASRTPPGLYWIRLSQGARSLLARAVVIR